MLRKASAHADSAAREGWHGIVAQRAALPSPGKKAEPAATLEPVGKRHMVLESPLRRVTAVVQERVDQPQGALVVVDVQIEGTHRVDQRVTGAAVAGVVASIPG